MTKSNTEHKRQRGQVAFHSGIAAELAVERHYLRKNYLHRASRWRCQSGEIDLVFEKNGTLIFVEVKKAKSFAQAAWRISKSQTRRIAAAATEFAASEPAGLLTDMRFDIALVDAAGAVEVQENVLFSD